MTDRAWFSCLLQHPARKRTGSILSTPEPAWGTSGEGSFQPITCTGTDNLARTTKRQNTQITQSNTMLKVAVVNSTTDTLKKPRLRDRTGRAWFSCLLRHPAR